MRTLQQSLRLAVAALALLATTALAQSPDEPAAGSDQLAETIAQSLQTIEFQLSVTPESAVRDLEAQRRRLAILEAENPDHPMIPELTRRIDELEADATAALGDDGEGAETGVVERSGLMVPMDPPPEVNTRMREVETLQTRADRELMRGEHASAAHYLDEADTAIDQIEEEYGDQIPPGYAALIIAKERLAALRDQIAERSTAD